MQLDNSLTVDRPSGIDCRDLAEVDMPRRVVFCLTWCCDKLTRSHVMQLTMMMMMAAAVAGDYLVVSIAIVIATAVVVVDADKSDDAAGPSARVCLSHAEVPSEGHQPSNPNNFYTICLFIFTIYLLLDTNFYSFIFLGFILIFRKFDLFHSTMLLVIIKY